MIGERLSFYVRESHHHHGVPVYQWLLTEGRRLGFSGGTAIATLAGFGRHGWHEAHFFELAGELPVITQFIGNHDQVEALLANAAQAGLTLFYNREQVEYGLTGDTRPAHA